MLNGMVGDGVVSVAGVGVMVDVGLLGGTS